MAKWTTSKLIGAWADQGRTNAAGRVRNYVEALRYYRPRGFSKLAREGEQIVRHLNRDIPSSDKVPFGGEFEWMADCDTLLTEWAQRVTRNPYVYFGSFEHSGDIGFIYAVETAQDDADLKLDEGDSVPRGFSGLAYFVNDHGNVRVSSYVRGRNVRTLIECV